MHHIGMFALAEFDQDLRLVGEPLAAPRKFLAIAVGNQAHVGIAGFAADITFRQQLLDRDLPSTADFGGAIGDAETACTKYPLDAIAVELEAGWQRVEVLLIRQAALARPSYPGFNLYQSETPSAIWLRALDHFRVFREAGPKRG